MTESRNLFTTALGSNGPITYNLAFIYVVSKLEHVKYSTLQYILMTFWSIKFVKASFFKDDYLMYYISR